jgi:multidrug efflux pump subunit AcrB
LYGFGFTLNNLTLMALSLCIGLLIDDAIVVRENIVRHLGMGKNHRTAALEGTDEIGLAVMATTFAIVAVFVPIAFMSGIVGKFFFQFGVTVSGGGAGVAVRQFTLDPMLSSVWHDPPGSRFKRVPWLGRFMDKVEHFIEWMHRVYGLHPRMGAWPSQERLAIAVLSFAGGVAILPMVGTEFIPEPTRAFTSLRLNTPVGPASSIRTARCARSRRH